MDNWISICVSEYIVHNTRIGTEIYATIVYATDAICLPPQRLSQNFFPIMNTYFKITRPRNGHQASYEKMPSMDKNITQPITKKHQIVINHYSNWNGNRRKW
eukprot:233892_1